MTGSEMKWNNPSRTLDDTLDSIALQNILVF